MATTAGERESTHHNRLSLLVRTQQSTCLCQPHPVVEINSCLEGGLMDSIILTSGQMADCSCCDWPFTKTDKVKTHLVPGHSNVNTAGLDCLACWTDGSAHIICWRQRRLWEVTAIGPAAHQLPSMPYAVPSCACMSVYCRFSTLTSVLQ